MTLMLPMTNFKLKTDQLDQKEDPGQIRQG